MLAPDHLWTFWTGENLWPAEIRLVCPFLSLVTISLTLSQILHQLLLQSKSFAFWHSVLNCPALFLQWSNIISLYRLILRTLERFNRKPLRINLLLFKLLLEFIYLFMFTVLVGKPEGERPLGRPRRRWEDNIKMDFQEVGGGCGDWMELAQDRESWRALVSTVMSFVFHKMWGISWLGAEPVSFSRRTLLHGVSK